MTSYYSQNLSASRLKRVYDLAPHRTKQYLSAEIDFVLSYLRKGDAVLDLGCGYGRIIPDLLNCGARIVYGMDSSYDNIKMGREFLREYSGWELMCMDAGNLGFCDKVFDLVLCVQNGISAFKVEPKQLISESLRVCKKGGTLLFSSYSEKFWEHRLQWFNAQSAEGLLGEIDWELTKNGVIVCKDGFKAVTYTIENFSDLVKVLPVKSDIIEVDNSSLFCVMRKT